VTGEFLSLRSLDLNHPLSFVAAEDLSKQLL